MIFKSIFGQEKAINFLKRDIENNNITHAYIFTGPMGVGKALTAIQFAKSIACFDNGCLKCDICRSFDNKVHPDFLYVKSEASYITIEQVRQLEHWSALKVGRAKRKIAIIKDVDKLTVEAANALLKTLEDPLENIVFICTTSNQNAVLPTILSRCRQVKFQAIPIDSLIRHLQSKEYPAQKVELAAKLSQGVFGKALELVENNDIWKFREKIIEIVKDASIANVTSVNNIVDKFFDCVKRFHAKTKIEVEEVEGLSKAANKILEQRAKRNETARNRYLTAMALDFWWFWLRDVVIYCETNDEQSLINKDYFDEIQKRCQNSEVNVCWYLMEKMPLLKDMLKKNINMQLAVETFLLQATEEAV